jgi:hypothetical protein
MAHNETKAFNPECAEPALLRAARTWCDFGIAAVGMLVVPALLIGALALLESLIPAAWQFAERPSVRAPVWRAAEQRPQEPTTACAQLEPAPCARD